MLRSGPRTASQVARVLRMSKGTVHRDLQRLVHDLLVQRGGSEGRVWVYYSLTPEGHSSLEEWESWQGGKGIPRGAGQTPAAHPS